MPEINVMRRRPVYRAVQYTGDNLKEVVDFLAFLGGKTVVRSTPDGISPEIEGQLVRCGDWLMWDVANQKLVTVIYHADEFEKIFEPALTTAVTVPSHSAPGVLAE
jgi:hypothetical protein